MGIAHRERTAGPGRRTTGLGVGVRRALAGTLLAVLLAGCGESARQLLETAELEEVQQAPERARELYERILREHPDTPEATTAAARLRALGSEPGR